MPELSNPSVADIVVVGSGAAALVAAIRAHDAGADVLLIERSDKIGGTSAVSGGGIWIPRNHHMMDLGIEDSREDALRYCTALAMGQVEQALIEAFVDTAPEMLAYVEAHTPLQFHAMTAPDYHPELDGARESGRSVEPAPFDSRTLGAWRTSLRAPGAFAFPITRQEAFGDYDAFYRPWNIPQDMVVARMGDNIVTLGQALVAGLLAAALDRGIPIALETRAQGLVRHDGRVAGVRATGPDGGVRTYHARKGVILACGGFEWNEHLRRAFLPGPIEAPNSPPVNEGDGLAMGLEIGADVANMADIWHFPSIVLPGETYDGQPLSRATGSERNGPHVIWVNSKGKRFVNEAANYNSIGKLLHVMATDGTGFENLPAWAIFDGQFREKYAFGTTMPQDRDPDWLIRAESLTDLAEQAGIDPQGLERTVANWNDYVAAGCDRDFNKGASAFDRFQGDREHAHPNLGTVAKPPFYALRIYTGALGTKGGLRIDRRAQVLDMSGQPIPGLYAAGNVAASVTGPGYYGRGSTLGPAMTWAYLAATACAAEAPHDIPSHMGVGQRTLAHLKSVLGR